LPVAQLSDLALYYTETGTGEPLILLHGAFGTGESHWRKQLPVFAQHFRVITPDLRGHGRSTNPSPELSLAILAEDTAALAQHLGLDSFHLGGFSLGGCAALVFAVRHPASVRSLLLCGTTYRRDDQFLRAIENDASLTANESWIRTLEEQHGAVYGKEHWKTLWKQLHHEALHRTDLTPAELQTVQAPTLLSLGDHDEYVSMTQALELRVALPQAELFVAPKATHWVHLTRANLFNAVALDFLLRHRTA
jgi:pimeloyl-ACP methyl ester carboxylesterase